MCKVCVEGVHTGFDSIGGEYSRMRQVIMCIKSSASQMKGTEVKEPGRRVRSRQVGKDLNEDRESFLQFTLEAAVKQGLKVWPFDRFPSWNYRFSTFCHSEKEARLSKN